MILLFTRIYLQEIKEANIFTFAGRLVSRNIINSTTESISP